MKLSESAPKTYCYVTNIYGLTAFDYAVETKLSMNVLDLLKQEMQEMEDQMTNPDECVFKDKFPIKNIYISLRDPVETKCQLPKLRLYLHHLLNVQQK